MEFRFAPFLISVVVAVVLFATMLVPIIGEATTTERTFDNRTDALWQVDALDSDSVYTFEWDHTTPTIATVNGETVNLANGTLICATDSFLIRYGLDGTGYYLQSVPGSTFNLIVYSAGTNQGDVTIEISSGTITATIVKGTTTTSTATFNEGWGIVADGAYVMKAPTQKAYVLDDSTVFALGLTTINGVWQNMFEIQGTVENVDVTQVYPDPATYTISDVVIHSVELNTYVELNQIESITFVATNIEDDSIVYNATYNYFIVPATVTAELSQHLNDTEGALVGIIPLLVIVGLVIGVVAILGRRAEIF